MVSAKRYLLPMLVLVLVLPLACQQAPDGSSRGKTESNPNIRFGMPGPATTDPRSRDAFLIERDQYVLSYNASTRTPNWVCWRLTKQDIGKAKRGPFSPDPALPHGIAKVTSHVYDGCGMDRGHMCPAQDRSSTQENMDATFMLTNVVPQAPNCNQRGWERLEAYCRDLTHDGHVLYIASGPHGVGGEGKLGVKKEIGKGDIDVTVPAKVWKVILVLPDETADPMKRTRVIATIFPNKQEVDYDWSKYRCSVAEVEALTGLKFWPRIPDEVATVLKAKTDEVKVHIPKREHE